jgi:hypothetical protein
MTPETARPVLTEHDKSVIARAREVGPALRASTSDHDRLAGWLLAELADLAERLASECGKHDATVAAFDEAASILANFDWERDDSQYALERIEMAILTGKPQ